MHSSRTPLSHNAIPRRHRKFLSLARAPTHEFALVVVRPPHRAPRTTSPNEQCNNPHRRIAQRTFQKHAFRNPALILKLTPRPSSNDFLNSDANKENWLSALWSGRYSPLAASSSAVSPSSSSSSSDAGSINVISPDLASLRITVMKDACAISASFTEVIFSFSSSSSY